MQPLFRDQVWDPDPDPDSHLGKVQCWDPEVDPDQNWDPDQDPDPDQDRYPEKDQDRDPDKEPNKDPDWEPELHRHKASLDIVSSFLIVILFMWYCYCWVNLSVPCHLKACEIYWLGEVIIIKKNECGKFHTWV